jgi:hypothetical protein
MNHVLTDELRFPAISGHVRISRLRDQCVLADGPNLVLQNALEVMAFALLGQDSIRYISFGKTGKPVTPGMTTVGSPVAQILLGDTGDTLPFVTRDSGGLRSIVTWAGLYTPIAPVTYDTLGLVSTTGGLFSAYATAETTLGAGETISVQWTIALRGI